MAREIRDLRQGAVKLEVAQSQAMRDLAQAPRRAGKRRGALQRADELGDLRPKAAGVCRPRKPDLRRP
jgi:hypothetical protein